MVLSNLEKTFRSTVGTMRWRIKFVVLGLGVIFAARIYTLSQDLLFSRLRFDAHGFRNWRASHWMRTDRQSAIFGMESRKSTFIRPAVFLQGTVTILLAGGYLFVIGLLAQLIAFLGGVGSFKTQAFLVLLGIAGLAVLLLSDGFDRRSSAW